MASKVLNIEIGDRITKVCMSSPKGKTYQIRSSFMFQTPDNAVTDGTINDTDVMAERLKSELIAHELGDVKNVVFTLSSGKVASREVMLPPVKDSRLKGLVETNAADYFPVDLTKYHVTYTLLERVEKGEEPGCRTLVLAAPLSFLEGYFALAGKCSLNVQAIDYNGNSQYQALKALNDSACTMYVNIDCNNFTVTFVQGKDLLLQRSFTYGGDELVISYMNAAGKSGDEYVSALSECSVQEPQFIKDGVMSEAEVKENLSRLVSSIVRTSDYFNSSHWETPVEKIVLMGPCSHLSGLREMVNSGTGLETNYMDDVPGIASFANSAASASVYISCMGSSVAPVDFVPPQFKSDKKKAKKAKADPDSLTGGIIICALCLVAALAMSYVAISGYSAAVKEKAAIEKQIADLEYTRNVYYSYNNYQSNAYALLALDAAAFSPNNELTAFIEELEEKMPESITVLSAVLSKDSVAMNVTVPTLGEVAVVIAQLRTFESIVDVQVGGIAETQDETGGSYVSFSVSALYDADAYAMLEGSLNQAAETSAAAAQPVATAAPADAG